ncbi:MAG TPA: 4,5-DOPA dioxygenase extradiol [Acidimicrobiia bacterium]|nr:4,5-DOPA dioxygenase extradiol [Acidimicrobiia bacterium]
MPAAFFGHGSPMNALDHNRYTEAWRAFGADVPRPRAILVVSAHWYINATAVTAMPSPRTVHDFYGFPEELFAVDYPAPGAPELAEEIAEVVKPTWVGLDRDSWGIDHGTWSVLVHAFPDADIPVLQLAINAMKPAEYHVELGTKLTALRRDGVMIIGSGNIVHNLRRVDLRQETTGFDWAQRFNEAAMACLLDSPGDAARLVEHPDYDLAAPTPDHFIPALYFAGIAAADSSNANVLIDGYLAGSLSMTAYGLGGACPTSTTADTSAASLPDVPADQANV